MIKRISWKEKQELNEIFAREVEKILTERRLEDINSLKKGKNKND